MSMTLVDCKMPGFVERAKKGRNREVLHEFVQSGAVCKKLVGWNHKDAHICAACMNTAAKRCGYPHVKAHMKDGEVYLVNELLLMCSG